jgi:hypothetical protein
MTLLTRNIYRATLSMSLVLSGLIVPVVAQAQNGPCTPSQTSYSTYTVLSFTSAGNCDWTVPNGVTSVDILVVGGGAGGFGGDFNGGNGGNGGDGGGVGGRKSLLVSPKTNLVISVGSGGLGGAGGDSSTPSGSPGGGSNVSSFDGDRGDGYVDTTDILSGSPVSYSTGGNGGSAGIDSPTVSAPANTGNGGNGGNSYAGRTGFAGANGGSGIVVVRYIRPPTGDNGAAARAKAQAAEDAAAAAAKAQQDHDTALALGTLALAIGTVESGLSTLTLAATKGVHPQIVPSKKKSKKVKKLKPKG